MYLFYSFSEFFVKCLAELAHKACHNFAMKGIEPRLVDRQGIRIFSVKLKKSLCNGLFKKHVWNTSVRHNTNRVKALLGACNKLADNKSAYLRICVGHRPDLLAVSVARAPLGMRFNKITVKIRAVVRVWHAPTAHADRGTGLYPHFFALIRDNTHYLVPLKGFCRPLNVAVNVGGIGKLVYVTLVNVVRNKSSQRLRGKPLNVAVFVISRYRAPIVNGVLIDKGKAVVNIIRRINASVLARLTFTPVFFDLFVCHRYEFNSRQYRHSSVCVETLGNRNCLPRHVGTAP